jgi:NADH dehydrogenase/NADH:ubiquinone oxidoreductase subunit G
MMKLTIDNQEIKVEPGATIMEAAAMIDLKTPIICYHDATTSEGLCRMCVVEIEGWRVLAPACVTQVSDGMVVNTENERVTRARRTILEMLNASVDLSEAPELQTQINDYQADTERFPDAKRRTVDVKDDNPFYVRDYSQCVMCWRCVQACGDDMQFTYALSTGGRGFESHISTFFSAPMPETTCVFCGNCVAVCPTNALVSKTEFFLEQGLDYDAIRIEKRKEQREMRNGGKQ